MNSLLQIFETFAGRGSRTAFVYRTGVRRLVFSYQDISELALKFSSWLAQHGINSGERLAIWAPNSPWWAVVYWGCILRGVIIVPIDFISERERAEKILKASGAKLLLQSRYKFSPLPPAANVMDIEELEYALVWIDPDKEIRPAKPGDVVELVYTSGTTGRPKGVALTHENLLANIKQVTQKIEIKPEYVFLSLLPLSHMFEQLGGFLVPLYVGGRVVYLRMVKSAAIMQALAREKISVMMAVPRVLQALRQGIERQLEARHLRPLFEYLARWLKGKPKASRKFWFRAINRKFGRQFKFFVSGGAALDPETFAFWDSLGMTVIEGYGLTECSPVLAVNSLAKQVPGSVGRCLTGVDLKVEQGEIMARGANVFGGYWDDAEATMAAFDSNGWFKTGDLGEFDKDGNLYIKGRKKELIVTSNGVNVYPEDIERRLNSQKGVKDSCVIGLDKGQGEEVHAVLILQPATAAQDIVSTANSGLEPGHRIGGYTIWPKGEFPKTTTLKTKRFKVKSGILSHRQNERNEPASRLATIVAQACRRPVSEISQQSRLVADLGLTSMARLELANLIELEYRFDFDDSQISQNTTVAGLQRIIEASPARPGRAKSRLWVHGRLARHSRYYFNQVFSVLLFKLLFSLKVSGLENLSNLQAPVIFIANHSSYLDGPSVYLSLPKRWQLAFSAPIYEGFFFKKKNWLTKFLGRASFEALSFISGLFLATENESFRGTLEFMGSLIDRDTNILLFPEGQRSWDGELLPFKPGLGEMIRELKVPILPVKIEGANDILPRGKFFQKRGTVRVKFGQPIYDYKKSPSQVIDAAGQALKNL